MAKMPMKKDPKTGKMVPAFTIDGKGKMQKGGQMKKTKGMSKGGVTKKKVGGAMAMKKTKGMARGGVMRKTRR